MELEENELIDAIQQRLLDDSMLSDLYIHARAKEASESFYSEHRSSQWRNGEEDVDVTDIFSDLFSASSSIQSVVAEAKESHALQTIYPDVDSETPDSDVESVHSCVSGVARLISQNLDRADDNSDLLNVIAKKIRERHDKECSESCSKLFEIGYVRLARLTQSLEDLPKEQHVSALNGWLTSTFDVHVVID